MMMRLPANLRVQLHRFRNLICLTPMLRPGRLQNLHALHLHHGAPVAFQADGLRIAGEIWPAAEQQADPPPAVILLHGCSMRGRRVALMRILAALLQQRGYTVLSFDARGFGESEKPADPQAIKGFDFAQDVIEAINHLLAHHAVDPQRVYLFGHSFGASSALEAEQRDPRVAGVALFGPPRRLAERFECEPALELALMLARLRRDMRLPYPLDPQVMRQMTMNRDIERFVERYRTAGHTPLMLIDAAHEDPRDLAHLRSVHARMMPSVEYWTVPGTDHYLNTGELLGRAIYHGPTLLSFVDRIDRFFRNTAPQPADHAPANASPAA